MKVVTDNFITFQTAKRLLRSIPVADSEEAERDFYLILIMLEQGIKLSEVLNKTVADGKEMAKVTSVPLSEAWYYLCGNREDTSPLIQGRYGKPMTVRNMQQRIERWADSFLTVGNKKITAESLVNTAYIRRYCCEFLVDEISFFEK